MSVNNNDGSNDTAVALSLQQAQLKLAPERVLLLGLSLLTVGTVGFYKIPGLLSDQAPGSRWVNAFYCAAVTLTT
jgi:hypothetical protein